MPKESNDIVKQELRMQSSFMHSMNSMFIIKSFNLCIKSITNSFQTRKGRLKHNTEVLREQVFYGSNLDFWLTYKLFKNEQYGLQQQR